MIMWTHLILPRSAFSRMMYSNVVMTTWKLPALMRAAASRRAWGVPLKMTAETAGAHFSNSSVQLVMVDSGTMTRNGPRCCFFSIRNVMSDSVWIVLPRPCGGGEQRWRVQGQ